jgi:large subunit ribosomal protein LP1
MSTTSTDSKTTATTVITTAFPKVDPERAVAFAALILADNNIAITPEKLQTLLKTAGITEVEPIWTTLFANALKDKNLKDILTAVATSGPHTGGNAAPHPPTCGGEDKDGDSGIDLGVDSESDDDIGCTFGFFD